MKASAIHQATCIHIDVVVASGESICAVVGSIRIDWSKQAHAAFLAVNLLRSHKSHLAVRHCGLLDMQVDSTQLHIALLEHRF